MMMKKLLICGLASSLFVGTPATLKAADATAPATLADRDFLTLPGGDWKLLWNDEFNGGSLDKGKWSIGLPWGGTDGTGRHHNDQYASYIMDDDINVQGGALHLTTQRRDITDKKGNVFHYSEGLITTSGKFRLTHGYLEILAKMPTEAGAGTWPAFWTLSDGWPPEFDIIEYWGSDNRIHQGTVTRKPDGGQRWDSFHQSQASVSGWHTYGLEWGPGYQLFNLDGKITNAIYGEQLAPPTSHYILLNSGIETARPPREGTVFPNDFVVDYVRVYARPDVPALLDGGFEAETLGPWSRWNEASVVDYGAKSGRRCLRVDAGGSGAETSSTMMQTIYGLQPNTRYTLTAFAKANGSATARLGVKEYGGEEMRTPEGVTASNDYRPLTFSFTTGPQATSAQIYCWAEGRGTAFFDEVKLAKF